MMPSFESVGARCASDGRQVPNICSRPETARTEAGPTAWVSLSTIEEPDDLMVLMIDPSCVGKNDGIS